MNDSDQNRPPATASVTVVAPSSAPSTSSPAKESMLLPHQPASSAHSPLRTAVQPTTATIRSAVDLTASEIAGIWKGEREFFVYLFFLSFFLGPRLD